MADENKRLKLQEIEDNFYEAVNQALAKSITPIYNTALLIFGVVFAYFVATQENHCYASGTEASAVEYDNYEDVSRQFHMMSYGGMVFLVLSAILYHLQAQEDMFATMRPFVLLVNILTFIWFLFLQYFRFKDTGRACSGDFLDVLPANFETVYLGDEGKWIVAYVIC